MGHPPARGAEGLSWFGSNGAGPYGPSTSPSAQAPQPCQLASTTPLGGPTDPGGACAEAHRLALRKGLGVHPSSSTGEDLHLGKLKPRFLHLLNVCEDEDGGFSDTEWSPGIAALVLTSCLTWLGPGQPPQWQVFFFFSFFLSFWAALHRL